MKYISILALSLFMSGFALGQTKMIAHRSHSGADRGFSLSGLDNFGEHPSMNLKNLTIDTSFRIKPDTVIIDSTLKLEESKSNKETRKRRKAVNTLKKTEKKEKTETSAVENEEKVLELAQNNAVISGNQHNIKRQNNKDYLGLFGLVMIPGIFVFAGVFKKKQL